MKNLAGALGKIRPRHAGAAIFTLACLAGTAIWGAGIYLNILQEESIPAPFRQIVSGSFAIMLACIQAVSLKISAAIFQGTENPGTERHRRNRPAG
jgi:hypothetical protein